MRTFVEQVYIPDVLLVASAYPEWTKIGGGTKNFLTYGGYGTGAVDDTASYLFPRGIIRDLDLDAPCAAGSGQDHRAGGALLVHATPDGDGAALHPYKGETEAKLHGP